MAILKQFLTFNQQVNYLKNEKRITVSDEQFAEDVLQRIGYFALMGGYKELFRIPFSKKYKPGTSFDEIVLLYQFDAELRELFLKYRNFAKVTGDPTVRGLCEQIAAQHKNHYDTLLQNLN